MAGPTCNLYSFTKPQDAARRLARVAPDLTGNLPPLPAFSRMPVAGYPDGAK